MKPTTLSLLPALVIAAACGGSGSTDVHNEQTPPESGAAVLPGDQEILNKAYDSNYHVPDGFFIDERASTTRSYTVHHVLDESGSFELCTDDLVEAQAWEDADNASRAVSGYYVSSYENDRYFEFVRELAYTEDVGNITDPTSPGFARIFKCSHTSRDGVDRSLFRGYAGRLNTSILDGENLREFAEYLWQFTFFDASGKKVIDSYTSGTFDRLEHTLLLALVFNQGADTCDRVDVIAWRYSADPSSGEITRQYEALKSIQATVIDGVPGLCE